MTHESFGGDAALRARLGVLRAEVTAALAELPGVRAVRLFGSLAEGRGDGFSDLDVRVVSDDVAATVAARDQALERIGPLALEWRIDPAAEPFAAVVLWREESCYHKLDLGVLPAEGEVGRAEGGDPYAGRVALPAPGTVAHRLLDHLLGLTRYVKARRRGQALTCWRFATSLAQEALRIRAEQARGWEPLERLGTGDYVALDGALTAVERARWQGLWAWSTPAAMDGQVRRLAERLVALSEAKAAWRGESLPMLPVKKLMCFVRDELDAEE